MFRNYIQVSLRNLSKNRVYAIINIFGLGIALAICIVAYFNYAFDARFDRMHKNFDNIYQVNSIRDLQGRNQAYGIVPASLGPEIENEIPGIEKVSRIFISNSPVKLGNDIFSRRISYVDPAFFEIFTIPLISGSYHSVENKNNILISEKLANTLFGESEPQGKSLLIINDNNEEFIYSVSGVFSDFPDNTSLRFDILTHVDNFLNMWKINDTDWRNWAHIMFVQTNSAASVSSIQKSMDQYLPIQNRAREDFIINGFTLVAMKDVGDNSREIWSNSLFPALHPAALVAPPIMALMILLIACFNFANTTIAATGRRLKEIGIRKTFGGLRKQLLVQFFMETILISTIAILLGVAIAKVLVPAYSSLWPYMSLIMTLKGHWDFIIFLALLLLSTGFLSGVYPALYISSLKPVDILRSRAKYGKTGLLSNILLTLQFTISIMALVMGLVFIENSKYQDTLDLGYDRDKLIVVPILNDFYHQYRESIIDNPLIISIAGSQQHIGFGYYRRSIKDENQQIEVDIHDIGPRYASTLGLRLIDGRLFDPLRTEADRQGSIIVNEKLLEDFGWHDAIGKTVSLHDTTRLTVIGVVENYYNSGVWNKIEPAFMQLVSEDIYRFMLIRANSENLPIVYDYLREKWQVLFPSYIFSGMYQEETLKEGKDINDSIMKINITLAIIATFLSLIGIYSLVSLSVMHRTKEIGIRNVLGSSVGNMIFLLSKRFIIILTIASLLGCSGGYFLSLMLMDSIWDYFVDITGWLLLSSILIMFVMTAFTITGKTYKAATTNPIRAIQSAE